MIGATCLLVAAGAGAVGAAIDPAADLTGNNRVLAGSDAFKAFTNDLLSQFSFGHDNFIKSVDASRTPKNPGGGVFTANSDGSQVSGDGTYYTGGGQSVGDGYLVDNTQQISVGTASLKSAIYAFAADGTTGWINADGDTTTTSSVGTTSGAAKAVGKELPIQGTTEALLFALDGLSILGNVPQAQTPNGISTKGVALTVHHYVPSGARFFPAFANAGAASTSGSTWTLPGVTFLASDVGGKIAIAGAANAGNNNIFTIASVTLPSTIVTVQAPVAETFSSSVNATVFSSRIYVVNDADTTYPNTAYGTVGGVYTFNNSLDVLRVLFGGLHHNGSTAAGKDPEQGTFDASSDVRRSLADSWGTIFSGTVANPTGKLNHVWRRSDLAGTTNAFIALVNFGARGIGAGSTPKTNPFANSGDANGINGTSLKVAGFPINSAITSLGGPGDLADFDPIRRAALTGPDPSAVPASAVAVDLEQVAENDSTLGLVLPIFPPDALDGAPPTAPAVYSAQFCSSGKFDLVSPGFTPSAAVGTAPGPQGPVFAGDYFLPYFLDTTVSPAVKHYNCIARSINPHAFGAPTPSDNRVFNLAVKSDTDGHYLKDLNQRFLTSTAFYRIHTSLSNVLVTAGTPSSGLVLATQVTADAQEAALIGADPFSIAFTARGVDAAFPLASALSLSGQASLGVAGQFDPTVASFPTDQNVKNLVLGQTPVYPLSRRIYLNTLVGFTENPPWSEAGITKATGTDPGVGPAYAFVQGAHAFGPPSGSTTRVTWTWNGTAAVPSAGSVDLGASTAVRGVQGQEAQFARAFQNSDHVGALATYWGFVPLPSAAEGYTVDFQGHPSGGVTAVDYDESLGTGALPLNGAGDTSTRYSAGNAASTAAFPKVNNEDATVVSPPDSITPYSLSGQAPPFPYDATREPSQLPWPGSVSGSL